MFMYREVLYKSMSIRIVFVYEKCTGARCIRHGFIDCFEIMKAVDTDIFNQHREIIRIWLAREYPAFGIFFGGKQGECSYVCAYIHHNAVIRQTEFGREVRVSEYHFVEYPPISHTAAYRDFHAIPEPIHNPFSTGEKAKKIEQIDMPIGYVSDYSHQKRSAPQKMHRAIIPFLRGSVHPHTKLSCLVWG